jgi:hypothetical protein
MPLAQAGDPLIDSLEHISNTYQQSGWSDGMGSAQRSRILYKTIGRFLR